MKNLVLMTFFGLLLISSCTCNDNKDHAEDINTDTVTNQSSNDMMMNDAPSMEEQRMMKMFNREHFTPEEIKEYRRMHDEMDWGNVPGFYPEASTRPLTEQDTKFLTEWGHKVMLNEIYARHGMIFTDEDLKSHFEMQGWYKGQHNDVQSMLTQQEKDNIAFLQNHPA